MGNAQAHRLVELARRGRSGSRPHAHTLGESDGDVVGQHGGSHVYLVPCSPGQAPRLRSGDMVVYRYCKDKAWYWSLGQVVCEESPVEAKLPHQQQQQPRRRRRLSIRRHSASSTEEESVQYRIRDWVLAKNTLSVHDTQAASRRLLHLPLAAAEAAGHEAGQVSAASAEVNSFSLHREPSVEALEMSPSASLRKEGSQGRNACTTTRTAYEELLERAEWPAWEQLLSELRQSLSPSKRVTTSGYTTAHAQTTKKSSSAGAAVVCEELDGVPYVTRQVLIAMLHLLHFLPDAAAVQPVRSAQEEWQQAKAALQRNDFFDTFQAFSALGQLDVDTLSEVADPIFDDIRERAHYVRHHIFCPSTTTSSVSSQQLLLSVPDVTASTAAATGPRTTRLYDWVQWQMSVLAAVEQRGEKYATQGIELDGRHRRSLSALLHDLHRRGLVFVPPQLPPTHNAHSTDLCNDEAAVAAAVAATEHVLPRSAVFARVRCEAVVHGRVTLTCEELDLLQRTAASAQDHTEHRITATPTTLSTPAADSTPVLRHTPPSPRSPVRITSITPATEAVCEAVLQSPCAALSSQEVSLHEEEGEESPTVIDIAACEGVQGEGDTPLLQTPEPQGHEVCSEHNHLSSSIRSAHTSVSSGGVVVSHISLSVTHEDDNNNSDETVSDLICEDECEDEDEEELPCLATVASMVELLYSEHSARIALELAEVSARYSLHVCYVRHGTCLCTRHAAHMQAALQQEKATHCRLAQLYSLNEKEQSQRAALCGKEHGIALEMMRCMPQEAYDLQRMKLAHDYACSLETLRYVIRQKQRRHLAAVDLLQEGQAGLIDASAVLQKSRSVRGLLAKMSAAMALLAEDECEGDFLHVTPLPRSMAQDLRQHYSVNKCEEGEQEALELRRALTRRLSVPPVCLPPHKTHNNSNNNCNSNSNSKSKVNTFCEVLYTRPTSTASHCTHSLTSNMPPQEEDDDDGHRIVHPPRVVLHTPPQQTASVMPLPSVSAAAVLQDGALLHAETEHEIELAQLRGLLEAQRLRTQAAEHRIRALQERLQHAPTPAPPGHHAQAGDAAPCEKVCYERTLLLKRMSALYDVLQGRQRLAEDGAHGRREEAETELRLLHAVCEAVPQDALPEPAQAALRACVAMVEQRRKALGQDQARRLREEEQLSDFFRTVNEALETVNVSLHT